MTKILLAVLAIVFVNPLCGQDSPSVAVRDTAMPPAHRHSPATATLMSAALPGLGQAYNRKYWKIPIIYGGFGGLAYAINFNNVRYKRYADALKVRLDDDPGTTDPYVAIYSVDNLVTLKNFYRRNRDLSLIFTGVLYVLNIIDAHVDAHLYHFDIGEDLSFRVRPMAPDPFSAGLSLSLTFK